MKDLKCSLKECRHNQGFSCVAKAIRVDDCAQCGSFEVSTKKLADSMFEIGDIGSKPDYDVDTAIACDTTNCLFNRSCSCCANGITVLGNTETGCKRADCATFTPKD